MPPNRPRARPGSDRTASPQNDPLGGGIRTRVAPPAATAVELPSGTWFLDLGNGQVAVFGTADDMRAAADYLAEHYPDGPVGRSSSLCTGRSWPWATSCAG